MAIVVLSIPQDELPSGMPLMSRTFVLAGETWSLGTRSVSFPVIPSEVTSASVAYENPPGAIFLNETWKGAAGFSIEASSFPMAPWRLGVELELELVGAKLEEEVRVSRFAGVERHADVRNATDIVPATASDHKQSLSTRISGSIPVNVWSFYWTYSWPCRTR